MSIRTLFILGSLLVATLLSAAIWSWGGSGSPAPSTRDSVNGFLEFLRQNVGPDWLFGEPSHGFTIDDWGCVLVRYPTHEEILASPRVPPPGEAIYTRMRFEFGKSKNWAATRERILSQLPVDLYVCDREASSDKALVIYGRESELLVDWFRNSLFDYGFTGVEEQRLSQSDWTSSLYKFLDPVVGMLPDVHPRPPEVSRWREARPDVDVLNDLNRLREYLPDYTPLLLKLGVESENPELRQAVGYGLASTNWFPLDAMDVLFELIEAESTQSYELFDFCLIRTVNSPWENRFRLHFVEHPNPEFRLRVIRSYHGLEPTKERLEPLRLGLQDEQDSLRKWTLYELRRFGALARPLLPEIRKLADVADSSSIDAVAAVVRAIEGG
ncbi:MAG: hypothetical protein AAF517_26930 [Planctomycetota bacterium]